MGKSGVFLYWEGMTMRYVMWTALAAGLMVVPAGVSQANDVIRLGGPSVQTGIVGSSDDTELVRSGYGGGYRGGHYGGHGGYRYGGYASYRGGYYGGGYGGYRYGGYYGGYYRPYYYSYYRPYYANYYYPSYYYPSYYYPSYSYAPYSYYPCAVQSAPVVVTQPGYASGYGNGNGYTQPPVGPAAPVVTPRPAIQQPIPNGNGNGTYPYDGGPSNPVPVPPGDISVPTNGNPGAIPREGKLVSLPSKTGVVLSQASIPETQRLRYVSYMGTQTSQPAPAVRINYPAYGEQPIAPVPRKITNR